MSKIKFFYALIILFSNSAFANYACMLKVPSLGFGNYDGFQLITNGTITVTCHRHDHHHNHHHHDDDHSDSDDDDHSDDGDHGHRPPPYTLSLSSGGATFTPRLLCVDGAVGTLPALEYNLYFHGYGGPIWGDGTSGTSLVHNCNVSPCRHTVYGILFGGQNVPGGQYSANLTVTLAY